VDADDYIESNLLKVAMDRLISDNSDQVKFNMFIEKPRKTIRGNHLKERVFDLSTDEKKANFIINEFLTYNVSWEACNCILRRSILVDNKIRFTEGINVAEDYCLHLKYLFFTNKVSTIPDCLYHYVQHEGSTTQEARTKILLNDKNELSYNLYEFCPEYFKDKFYHVFDATISLSLWHSRFLISKKQAKQYLEHINNIDKKEFFDKNCKEVYQKKKKYNIKKYGFIKGQRINALKYFLYKRNYFLYWLRYKTISFFELPIKLIRKLKVRSE